MKTVNHPGSIIKFQGELCEVVGIATRKVLFIREINATACEKCGEIKEYAVVEESPNFQGSVEAVKTLEEI